MSTLSKLLDILSATDRVAPDLFKALTLIVRSSAIDLEELKPYLKSDKRPRL